jgi:hypothetical protein
MGLVGLDTGLVSVVGCAGSRLASRRGHRLEESGTWLVVVGLIARHNPKLLEFQLSNLRPKPLLRRLKRYVYK